MRFFIIFIIIALPNIAHSLSLKKDFGAVGDGLTDDSINFSNFINACQNLSEHCLIEKGNFLIMSPPHYK